ncbi:MAG: NADP-dependent oxidoreductase [Flavobacteriales bacterium]|nr:NADP-dependent oxidoreductase [Flavobacteriales bacterium]
MKALQFKGNGDLEQQLFLNNIDMPIISAQQVLIEVHAASVNPVDFKVVNGNIKRFLKLTMPASVGYDIAGTIIKKGNNVSNFEVGDEIFGVLSSKQPGSIAEYVAIDSATISHKPTNVSLQVAASLPLVGLTAVQCFKKAKLKSGDRILIHAGSGGVGSFAIQYAKLKGAYVYTTTSTKNVDWVKQLGADRVIDYSKEDYLEVTKNLDLVLDTLGDKYKLDAFKVVKKGGTVMSIVGQNVDDATAKAFNMNWLVRLVLLFMRRKFTKQARVHSVFYKSTVMLPNRAQLKEIKGLIEREEIKPVIDKTFSLSDSVKALMYQKSGRAKGKVVIKIK